MLETESKRIKVFFFLKKIFVHLLCVWKTRDKERESEGHDVNVNICKIQKVKPKEGKLKIKKKISIREFILWQKSDRKGDNSL